MKTLLLSAVSVSTLIALAACSTFEAQRPRILDLKAGDTYFCMREVLAEIDGNLSCNWAPTIAEACQYHALPTNLPKARTAAAPDRAGQCNNGERLVQVRIK